MCHSDSLIYMVTLFNHLDIFHHLCLQFVGAIILQITHPSLHTPLFHKLDGH